MRNALKGLDEMKNDIGALMEAVERLAEHVGGLQKSLEAIDFSRGIDAITSASSLFRSVSDELARLRDVVGKLSDDIDEFKKVVSSELVRIRTDINRLETSVAEISKAVGEEVEEE